MLLRFMNHVRMCRSRNSLLAKLWQNENPQLKKQRKAMLEAQRNEIEGIFLINILLKQTNKKQ